ncbi:hypothetical protein [Marinifilum flexuosum]|nr:hypothetical protein [Marinifilum flexuosum]
MKPEFIITSISNTSIDFNKNEMPLNLGINLEISAQATGNFSEYLNDDMSINKTKLLQDILQGKISITGKD